MSDLKEFADQLQEEVVSDMAEAYFGRRKDLDDLLEGFGRMVEELRGQLPRLLEAAARLHRLLLDRETAEAFYEALDVSPSRIPFPEEPPRPFFDRIPFAFTGAGRYERCVFRCYDLLHQAVDEYRNGRYYDDPESKGRKRLTVHYLRVKSLAEQLNAAIEKVNKRGLGDALQYVRNMDPDHVGRERLLGDAGDQGDELNRDMAFALIDFEALSLPDVQELPPLYKARPVIKTFCAGVYAARREEAGRAMASLVETDRNEAVR